MKPNAVLATNTSSIVLEQLAEKLDATSATHRAALFQSRHAHAAGRSHPSGEHRPASRCRPVSAFARQIDKLAIACHSAPGFLVNRVLMPYLSEAVRAAQEGIPLALIDRAAEEFGMPMGPIELADVVGLDVVMSVGKVFFETGAEVPPVLATPFAQKKFGKKTGEGFYVWQNDKPVKPPATGQHAPDDLQDRLLLPLRQRSGRGAAASASSRTPTSSTPA